MEHIQNNYGTINEFEMDILGLKFKKDENNNQIYTKNGDPVMYRTEPSIRAIRIALPFMINEGLSIEAEAKNASWEAVSNEVITQNCNVDFNLLAKIIHEEFKRCFEIKK